MKKERVRYYVVYIYGYGGLWLKSLLILEVSGVVGIGMVGVVWRGVGRFVYV